MRFSIIDDTLLNGTQLVTITGTLLISQQEWILSKINATRQDVVRIIDNELAQLTLDIPEKALEQDGTDIQATISVDRPVDCDVSIFLFQVIQL
ncbi:MAG: hypothetical protein OMM_11332 [Candidatus Magnetoglobus multicellularis str. Araruama]|uniref:Uncharacterized protein n=1 Tax=Candidatus Magnetoglobus multicellularis str. Araruama TaxID=890399 RepID=A0A1V1NYI3_9BACT|nr:MAG: hypothetical protein OMM_11332 [Candidatus Magnetoglobus multicellularis str. Araruama]